MDRIGYRSAPGGAHSKKSRRLTHSLLLFAILFVFPSSAILAQSPEWTKQRVGTMAWLHGVFFLDQNRGWIVGSKGTLLSTVDGGRTWQGKPSPSTDILRDIFFLDEQNGWLVCEKNIYEQLKYKDEPRTYLMQTTDGGQQWNRINIEGLDLDIRLLRAVFSRNGRGWAFGEAGSIPPLAASDETGVNEALKPKPDAGAKATPLSGSQAGQPK